MIAQVYQTLGNVLVLLLLLACSAFFSGSETAFFNLTQRQIRLFEASPVRLQKLAAHLLRQPGHLLNCLLFGNMMVNVLTLHDSRGCPPAVRFFRADSQEHLSAPG
jgi:Mg2+/Co2+ transporter CorB